MDPADAAVENVRLKTSMGEFIFCQQGNFTFVVKQDFTAEVGEEEEEEKKEE